jgi:ketosteroid isomerase-like protein
MFANPPFRIAITAACLILGTALAASHASAAPQPVPRGQRHEFRREIDQKEEAWRSAMLQRNSIALEALLADDYTAITATGAIQTKEQALASLRSGAYQLSALTISDRKVRVYGSTAVVTSMAELSGTRDHQDMTGRYRYTRVYVRSPQGQWKIVSFEASRIQEPGEHK